MANVAWEYSAFAEDHLCGAPDLEVYLNTIGADFWNFAFRTTVGPPCIIFQRPPAATQAYEYKVVYENDLCGSADVAAALNALGVDFWAFSFRMEVGIPKLIFQREYVEPGPE